MDNNEQAVAAVDSEISVIMWALRIGCLGVTTGWRQGMKTAEVLLAAENKYLGTAEGAAEKQALEEFAKRLRVWVREVCERIAVEKATAEEAAGGSSGFES
jgi:hypothetical protein